MQSPLPALLLLLLLGSALCKRPASHGHLGKLTGYPPGEFDYAVTSSDESKLSSGSPVLVQIPNPDDPKAGGRCICIQDISSDSGNVWNQIVGLDDYVGKVPKLKECKNYFTKVNEDGTRTIKTKMVVGVMPGYKYECYYDHTLHPTKSSLTWSLDYDKYSDFDDVQGHWHVKSLSPSRTRVFYAADLKLRGAVPGPIMNFLSKVALKESTTWVKKQSEKAFEKGGQAESFMAPQA